MGGEGRSNRFRRSFPFHGISGGNRPGRSGRAIGRPATFEPQQEHPERGADASGIVAVVVR
jgi:hypothetical protein